MGLTIHYSALLKERTMLPQFTDEVADICQTMGWSIEKDNWTITHDPFPLTTKMGDYLDKREDEA